MLTFHQHGNTLVAVILFFVFRNSIG